MRTPLVSVLVPAHNAATTIRATVASVLEPARDDVELVVINDGSTDDTAEVISALTADYPSLTAVHQANGGPSAARNAGIAAARGTWLLFLDADDTLAPGGLDALLDAASSQPQHAWFHGAWNRTIGDQPATHYPAERLYGAATVLSSRCPFAIHACLISRAAVEAVGGFDATLRTCEDWDLWARLARSGVEPIPVDATVAEYRVRPASASMATARMLADGLTVIDRGHTDLELPDGDRRAARAGFASYIAGIAIGQGQDPGWVFDEAGDLHSPDVDPSTVAQMLVIAVALGRLTSPATWPTGDVALETTLRAYLERLEAVTGATALARRTQRRLESELAATLGRAAAPVAVGGALIVDLDLALAPFGDLPIGPHIERVHARAWLDGQPVGSAEIVPIGSTVEGATLLDALLERASWSALEHLVLIPLLDTLTTDVAPSGECVIRRGATVLARPPVPPATQRDLLDLTGWTLFLQELLGMPAAAPERFYDATAEERPPASLRATGPITVELTAPLPEITSASDRVLVNVTLGGEPLDGVWLSTRDGAITAPRLRFQLLLRSGAQLVRVAMRGWLSDGSRADGPLGEVLRAGAQRAAATASVPTAAVLHPRADAAPVPARHQVRTASGAVAATLLRTAGALQRPVSPSTSPPALPGHDGPVPPPAVRLSAALRADGPPQSAGAPVPVDAAPPIHGRPRRSAASFEALFAGAADPWRYASGYEQTKYEQTLSLLPPNTRTVMELACAEGHFTEQVARVVDRVVASDVSTLALERAAERCAVVGNVEFSRVDLFQEPIPGRWEAVVCSEVLYYAGGFEELGQIAAKLAAAVEPGGVLLTAHANLVVDDPSQPGFDWDEQYGSLGIERALLATELLTLEEEILTPMYRVQRYRRPSRLARWRRAPAAIRRTAEPSADLSDDVKAHFLPSGGEPAHRRSAGSTKPPPLEVPILMYHRVAPDGPESMRRYRVTPEAFDEQLTFFTRAGYTAITPADWRDAVTLGRPLPEQPILLTFDDGFQDFADHAAPALLAHGLTATVLLVSDLVGASNLWDAARDPQPLMGWDTIRALAEQGFEFGGHTRTHPPLTALPAAGIVDEIAGSMAAISEALGAPPASFAYPFGDVTDGIRALAGLAGIELGFGCESRIANQEDDLLLLPRIEVRGDRPLSDLLRQLSAW